MVTYRFIQVPEQALAKQAKAILAILEEAHEIGKTELLTLISARLKSRQKPQRLLSYYQGSLIKAGAIETIRSVVR
jgi:DUF917 family protein